MNEQKVIIEEEIQYSTSVPNDLLQYKELSLEAKGLYSMMLSFSKKWSFFKSDLANRSNNSYYSTMKAWKELEDLGYIESKRLREGGKLKGIQYTIKRSPICEIRKQVKSQNKPICESLKQVSRQLLLNNIDSSININQDLNLNEDFEKKSSDTQKTSKKSKEESVHHIVIKHFFEVLHEDFVFCPEDAKAVSLLIGKTKKLFKKKNREITDESISNFLIILLDNLPEFYQDKDMKLINSNFNQIVDTLKKNQNGNQSYQPRQTSYEAARESAQRYSPFKQRRSDS